MHTRDLWPFRPQPHEDETLSSWITRLAFGHGLSLSTFLTIVDTGVNTATLDWDADPLLLEVLAARTAQPLADLERRRLRLGNLAADLLYRNAFGPAVQYCPACLSETAYFRRSWRLCFVRFCPLHGAVLADSCSQCGGSIRLEELDPAFGKLSACRNCMHDLASDAPSYIDEERVMRAAQLQNHLALIIGSA
jgi:TniQ